MNELLKKRNLLLALLLAPALAGAVEIPSIPALGELQGMAAATGAPAPAAVPAAKAAKLVSIAWEEADQHVGQFVEVEGLVTHTYANEKVCYLNFTKEYKTSVTLVIFGNAYSKFPSGPEFVYKDQVIRVTGVVSRSSWGQLQIIINSPEQIRVVSNGPQVQLMNWEDVTAADEGKVISVEGTVVSVTASQKVAFLNFHKNWTRYMAGVIFGTTMSRFPQDLVAAYEGHKVRMTGSVRLYEGHPEIVLLSPSQIQVQDPAPAAKALRIELAKDRIEKDDGDSIGYTFTAEDGVKGIGGAPFTGELRLLGYDTPEIIHPQHGIFFNQEHGREAAKLTNSLLAAADKIEFLTRGELDKYGRVLGYLYIDGKLLGVLQIKAGLAYESVSAYGDNGFPEQAKQIMDAWAKSPIRKDIEAGRKPAFINPGLWRKTFQMHDMAMSPEKWASMDKAEKAKLVAEVKRKAAENAEKAQKDAASPQPQP